MRNIHSPRDRCRFGGSMFSGDKPMLLSELNSDQLSSVEIAVSAQNSRLDEIVELLEKIINIFFIGSAPTTHLKPQKNN
jgi:hypothetical protein